MYHRARRGHIGRPVLCKNTNIFRVTQRTSSVYKMPERLSPPSFEPDTVLCGGAYQLDPPSCHLLRERLFWARNALSQKSLSSCTSYHTIANRDLIVLSIMPNTRSVQQDYLRPWKAGRASIQGRGRISGDTTPKFCCWLDNLRPLQASW
jgi:hypothetical protein